MIMMMIQSFAVTITLAINAYRFVRIWSGFAKCQMPSLKHKWKQKLMWSNIFGCQ